MAAAMGSRDCNKAANALTPIGPVVENLFGDNAAGRVSEKVNPRGRLLAVEEVFQSIHRTSCLDFDCSGVHSLNRIKVEVALLESGFKMFPCKAEAQRTDLKLIAAEGIESSEINKGSRHNL